MLMFPAQPRASLRAIQQPKTKLYANKPLIQAEAVGFSQIDESGDMAVRSVKHIVKKVQERDQGMRRQDTVFTYSLHPV